jgi:sugar lactone lactonase YvrE
MGVFITKWGGNGAFVNPMGIAIDSIGNVYVVDQVHQRVAKFTSNGMFITDWASGFNPTDIAIDSSDNVYVTEMYDSRIAKFASDGTLITKWNTGPISRGIAVDSSDNIWVTSANNGDTNYLVQKFTSGGILLDQWNSAGTDGVNIPTFNGYGIAFDSQGNLFIADTFNNRIQKYETDGTLITQWGNMGTGEGEFNSPHDLAINSQDNIFVSDTVNHRVQVFAKSTIIINNPPVAFDDIIITKINTPITITLEASDSDLGDYINSYNILSGPIHGQISNFNSANGTLTYTPNNNFVGKDSFTFKVTDSHGLESTNIGKIIIIVKQSSSPCKCHHHGSFN